MLYQYYPTPSCRMGALWVLSDIKDACIVEFGPAGTTHFSLEGMSNLNSEPQIHAYTTHISEHDLTFGKTERLEQAVKEVDQRLKPKVIFVMGSTLTSIIGIDLKSVCLDLEDQVGAKLLAVSSDGFKGDFSYGIEEILDLLAKEVVKPQEDLIPLTYNLVGAHMDSLSSKSDVKAVKRLMKSVFGATCNTVFTSGTSMVELENAGRASLNIAMRSEAISACKRLNKQPYTKVLPYGTQGISEFVESVTSVTGWESDKKVLKTLIMEGKQLERRMAEVFKEIEARVLLTGPQEVVQGVESILKSCGVEEVMGLVTHKCKGESQHKDRASERDKKEALKIFNPNVVLGDGVVIEMSKKNRGNRMHLQISNPNVNHVILHHEQPQMSIDGLRYLVQSILNEYSKRN